MTVGAVLADPAQRVPVGYWCANVAYTDGGTEMWWLGWEWFTSPRRALEWLCHAARLMAEQLSPDAGRVVGAWVNGEGQASARALLRDHERCVLPVWDDGVCYELSIHPFASPPLIGTKRFAPGEALR